MKARLNSEFRGVGELHPTVLNAELNEKRPNGKAGLWTKSWRTLVLLAATAALPASLCAQTFEPVPALSFTKAFQGADPLSQVIGIASTGAAFNFSGAVVNGTGGTWLTISNNGCCYATPSAVTVSAHPALTLAAGTYTAQVVIKSQSGTITMTIPVSLTIRPLTDAFFDTLAGGLTYYMVTAGTGPPAQPLAIRNGGTGTLAWTATESTSDGGNWLTLSATAGTAPSVLNVALVPANLPGKGLTAGTFVGQVVLETSGDSVTVPVIVTVGASVFRQVNGLNFTKLYEGTDPLPQVITVSSTGADFAFSASAEVYSAGNWLTITQGNGCCYSTPQAITVSANPAVVQVAGTYTGQIVVKTQGGGKALVIPVSLAIEAPTSAFFDALPGELTFSMATSGGAPPAQVVQIRNAGAGSLAWSLTTTTADGGQWLSASHTSGTAPGSVSIGITLAHLPGQGLSAGTFTGQVLLVSGQDRVTIPITMSVAASVFREVIPLNFTKTLQGSDPLPQVISVASTGASISFYATAVTSTGGSWLTITDGNGCCYATPQAVTVSVSASVLLTAGTYSGEVIVKSQSGNEALVVPVTLTVQPSTATYFDTLPGELTYSMATGGKAPPAQSVQIRDAGGGTLSWTAGKSTADGGNWITLSAPTGTAPDFVDISIFPTNLPGQGLVAGTFTGQVLLQAASESVTIPITVVVGASVFGQINPLSFTKTFQGKDPLPQVITLASTGTNINFYATAATSTGGNWLTITNGNGCCYATPQAITVTANPLVSLAAGTYTGEVIIKSQAGDQSVVVPVTLTVEPTAGIFFDTVQGAITYSLAAGGSAPPSQPVQIRNAGAGTLDWTVTTSTADGGAWITLSSFSGAAPATLSVGIKVANLPGQGLVNGTYTGQVVLRTGLDRVSIPVVVTVNPLTFSQLGQINFVKTFQGANPASQIVTVASSGTNFAYYATAVSSTGGTWLTISNGNGCCYTTGTTMTVGASPAVTLAAGIYTAEIIIKKQAGDESMVIPVTLTVNGTTATAAPVFNPPGGSYSTTPVLVTITSSTHESGIHYTTDGSQPTTSSTLYSGPIQVNASQTIKAIAIAPGYPQSSTSTAAYVITAPIAATPAATQTITITDATVGATIYYTTDGSTPTVSSKIYTGPITLSASSVLKFIAVAPDHAQSAVRTVTTTIQ